MHDTKVMTARPEVQRESMVDFAAHSVTKVSGAIVERNLIERFGVSAPMARRVVEDAKLRVRRQGGKFYDHRLSASDVSNVGRMRKDDARD